MPSTQFWQRLVQDGHIAGDPNYYSTGQAQAGEYAHAFRTAWTSISASGDQAAKDWFWSTMVSDGYIEGDPAYYATGQAQPAEFEHAFDVADAAALGQGTEEASAAAARPEALPGTQVVGDTRIPVGMRLVRVTDPAGSDLPELYFLVGDVYGVNLAYEIGDTAALDSMFGGVGSFDSLDTFTQAQFDASDALVVGTVDEIIGTTESLQAQFERDMRAAGLESPPAWLAGDQQAMTVFVTSVNEGWSNERMYHALSSTNAFRGRFDGIDVIKSQLGTSSWVESIAEYTSREDQIRSDILSSRGPAADTSQQYVSSLIASGWQPDEVGELLALEKRVKANPDALDNINEILTFQGMDALSPDDFVSFLQDQDAATIDSEFTPSELFEGVNDALRFQALLTEGLDISPEFATELGTGVSESIGSEEQFSRQAQLAAGFVAQHANELSLGQMGLERDDIIAAMFGEAREGGKSVSEVNQILEKFAKERSRAAQGHARAQAYIDGSGRLVAQGFADF